MYRLAKLGFTQSYTYFPWRNSKRELDRVLHRADPDRGQASSSARTSGPTRRTSSPSTCRSAAGRRSCTRLILAATLGASYGIYGPPFELHGAPAARAGRARSTSTRRSTSSATGTSTGPDSLRELIARVNRIRRENPALQSDREPALPHVDNEQLLCLQQGERRPDNLVLVVVNLDPHHAQAGWVELDLAALGLEPDAAVPGARPADRRALSSGTARATTLQLDPHQVPRAYLPGAPPGAHGAGFRLLRLEETMAILTEERSGGGRRRGVDGGRRSALVQGRDHLRGARARLLRPQRRRHRRLPRADRASSTTCATSASPPSGCCPSTPRPCATTATTSPTTPASTRLRHARGLPASSSTRPTSAACRSSPSWSSTTPRTSTPGSSARGAPRPARPERDFYVWSDTDTKYAGTRIIFTDTETSNWTWDPVANAYYWHRFFRHQPDLNFDNPRVQEELFKALDFWLEMGVDGLRLDAIPYLFEREGTNSENLPETHAVPEEAARPRRREISRPHAAGRGQPVAGGRRSPTSATATSATWRSTSR